MSHASRRLWSWLIFDVGQSIKRATSFPLLFVAVPSVGFAHGQQVLFTPIGQFVSFLAVAMLSLCLPLTWRQRAILIGVPSVLSPVIWFLPGIFPFMSKRYGYGTQPWFNLGVLSFIVLAAAAYVGILLTRKKPNKAPEPTT